MSEDREMAMKVAIKALLLAAKDQGLHVDDLCDEAVQLINGRPGLESHEAIAVATIRHLAFEVSIRG